MSRTPPASVRLTCGLLNYDQVAVSRYYYNSHLKEAFMYDAIARQLARNMVYATPTQKRKGLPLLVLGVLPIYTLLRAKRCYNRMITKSYNMFKSRLFGAQGAMRMCYHNATDVLNHDCLNVQVIQNITNFKCTSRKKTLITSNHSRQNLTKNTSPSARQHAKFFFNPGLLLEATLYGEQKEKLYGVKTKTYAVGWSNASLFALLLLERIIGKSNRTFGPTVPHTIAQGANLRKKTFKTFYDVLSVQQLQSGQYLKMRKTQNFPKSTLRRNIVLEKDQKREEFTVKKVASNNNPGGWNNRWNNPPKSYAQKGCCLHTTLRTRIVDFDHAKTALKSKFNVVPKFWISRRFNTALVWHLFCHVEGQVSAGHRHLWPYERRCCTYTNRVTKPTVLFTHNLTDPQMLGGWSRLKSAFLFEFDVSGGNKKSDQVKSLLPTMSLRF